MKWLEVRIVMPSEWLVEQRRIRTLDCDRQPLVNERPFSAVTRHFTDLAAKVFEEIVCRVVRWAQDLHGDWKESVRRMDVGVFLSFPGSSEFGHLSTSTGCGSDIRVCQGAHNCDVPYQQLPWAPWNKCVGPYIIIYIIYYIICYYYYIIVTVFACYIIGFSDIKLSEADVVFILFVCVCSSKKNWKKNYSSEIDETVFYAEP